MPQPTQSDLHVNRPLSDISVMAVYEETEFIADKVFKNIPVDKATDSYFVYDAGDFNRDSMQVRADGAESAGDGWDVSTDTYSCDVFALHHDVSDRRRANTDAPLNEDADATRYLTHKALLKREKDFVTNFFTAGIWTGAVDTASGSLSGTSFVPTTKFDNSSGTPIKCFKEQLVANKGLTGFRMNTLVMGEEVWNAIQDSADFLARITGGSTNQNPAIVSLQQLAAILGIDNVYVAGAVQNTATEGQTASNSFLFGESALLCYVPKTAGVRTPSAGYTFAWKQYGAGAASNRIKKFRMEQNASDRIEIEMAYDMKVINAKMGAFMTDLLT